MVSGSDSGVVGGERVEDCPVSVPSLVWVVVASSKAVFGRLIASDSMSGGGVNSEGILVAIIS